MLKEYSLKLENEQALLLEAKAHENALAEKDLERQAEQAESQLEQILSTAEREWEKAGKTVRAAHRNWLRTFQKGLEEKRALWETNYVEFLAEKAEWTDRQYVNAAGGGSLALARKGGADAEKALEKALSAARPSAGEENSRENAEKLVKANLEGLFKSEILGNLEAMAESMAESARNNRFTGYGDFDIVYFFPA